MSVELGADFAAVVEINPSPNNLIDVALALYSGAALSLPPGGFERFGLAVKSAPPHALVIAPLEETPIWPLKRRAAPCAPAAEASLRQRPVSYVPYVEQLHPKIWEHRERLRPPRPHTVMTAVRGAALDRRNTRDQLRVDVQKREKRIDVASIERIMKPVSEFEIPQRHRDLSIAQPGPRRTSCRSTI